MDLLSAVFQVKTPFTTILCKVGTLSHQYTRIDLLLPRQYPGLDPIPVSTPDRVFCPCSITGQNPSLVSVLVSILGQILLLLSILHKIFPPSSIQDRVSCPLQYPTPDLFPPSCYGSNHLSVFEVTSSHLNVRGHINSPFSITGSISPLSHSRLFLSPFKSHVE